MLVTQPDFVEDVLLTPAMHSKQLLKVWHEELSLTYSNARAAVQAALRLNCLPQSRPQQWC